MSAGGVGGPASPSHPGISGEKTPGQSGPLEARQVPPVLFASKSLCVPHKFQFIPHKVSSFSHSFFFFFGRTARHGGS